MKKLIALSSFFLIACSLFAQDIQLPAPDRKGGKPLMQALNETKIDSFLSG